MKSFTHFGVGLAVAALAGKSGMWKEAFLIVLGSQLPDIDTKLSAISSLAKPVSRLAGKHFKHRGFTHSLFFVFLLALVNAYVGLGALSHVLSDLLNPNGVKLLWPKKGYINLFNGFVKTGTNSEKAFCYVVMIAALVVCLSDLLEISIWGWL